MTSQYDRSQMRQMAEAAALGKAQLLDRGGYLIVQNDMLRIQLPFLVQKYGKDARDAIMIWLYLLAYVDGLQTSDFWMWAYPSRDQICADLAIGVNRFRKLVQLLEDEGLAQISKVNRPGKQPKLFFLPLITDIRH